MKYKKNFLTQVVLRLDFAPLTALATDKRPPFSDDIKERFPNVAAAQASQIQWTIGPSGTGFEQQNRGWVWTHRSESNKRAVVLSQEHLSLEYSGGEYIDFEEFSESIRFVLAPLVTRTAVPEFTRIGLRFIDEIDLGAGDPLNWQGLVKQELDISVRAGLMPKLRLTRSMHQLIASADDVSVTFNYGLFNPDYPSPVARRFFVLDFDASVTGGVAANEALNRIREMNALCESMFENSIEDGLRNIMEIEKDDRTK